MLITDPYRALQAEMHAAHPSYGTASMHHAPMVQRLMGEFGAVELLDYGAGKCRLAQALIARGMTFIYHAYEPSNPVISEAPRPCHFVACIDVLEHVEEECIDAVLDDLRRVTGGVAFLTVATGPAVKKLPDGRNAHILQRPFVWWFPKIESRFIVRRVSPRTDRAFWLVVT